MPDTCVVKCRAEELAAMNENWEGNMDCFVLSGLEKRETDDTGRPVHITLKEEERNLLEQYMRERVRPEERFHSRIFHGVKEGLNIKVDLERLSLGDGF